MLPDDENTYFPELPPDRQHEADIWLREYLSLVLRIARQGEDRNRYPQPPLDGVHGTGTICTPSAQSGTKINL